MVCRRLLMERQTPKGARIRVNASLSKCVPGRGTLDAGGHSLELGESEKVQLLTTRHVVKLPKRIPTGIRSTVKPYGRQWVINPV